MSGYGRENRINNDERKEQNKVRARRMVPAMGVACVIFVRTMIVDVK